MHWGKELHFPDAEQRLQLQALHLESYQVMPTWVGSWAQNALGFKERGSTEEFKQECTFFAKKLREKAYPVQTVREIIDQYCWNNREKKIKKNNNKLIVVPF